MTVTDTNQAPHDVGERREVDVCKIVASRNYRKVRDRAADAELLESVKRHGVLQELGAVTLADDTVELVWGHRRLEAAMAAGLELVPVRVFERDSMDERELLELRLVENVQRKDPDPIDEARALQQAIDSGVSVADVARRIGRSKRWVLRRAQLANVSERWAALFHGKPAAEDAKRMHLAKDKKARHLELAEIRRAITPEVLEVLAVLGHAAQDEVLDNCRDAWDFHDEAANVHETVSRSTTRLDVAPWPLDDDTLVPKAGSCSTCAKHTGAEPELFEAVMEDRAHGAEPKKGARCTDTDCWASKLNAYRAGRLDAARAKHPELVLLQGKNDHTQRRVGEGPKLLDAWRWDECKAGDPGALRGFIYTGKKAGTVVWCRTDRGGSSSSTKKKAAKKAAPGSPEARRAAKARWTARWRAHAVDQVRARLLEAKWPVATMAQATWPEQAAFLLTLANNYGLPHEHLHVFDEKKRRNAVDTELANGGPDLAALWFKVRERVELVLVRSHAKLDVVSSKIWPEALFVAERVLGLTQDELEREAHEAVPMPRSAKPPAKKKKAKARKAKATKKKPKPEPAAT